MHINRCRFRSQNYISCNFCYHANYKTNNLKEFYLSRIYLVSIHNKLNAKETCLSYVYRMQVIRMHFTLQIKSDKGYFFFIWDMLLHLGRNPDDVFTWYYISWILARVTFNSLHLFKILQTNKTIDLQWMRTTHNLYVFEAICLTFNMVMYAVIYSSFPTYISLFRIWI